MASTGARFRPNVVKPPDKGSFPLDHLGVCHDTMKSWMECMKNNQYSHEKCRSYSASYLQCRIENNLMDKDEIKHLGFSEDEWKEAASLYRKRTS